MMEVGKRTHHHRVGPGSVFREQAWVAAQVGMIGHVVHLAVVAGFQPLTEPFGHIVIDRPGFRKPGFLRTGTCCRFNQAVFKVGGRHGLT